MDWGDGGKVGSWIICGTAGGVMSGVPPTPSRYLTAWSVFRRCELLAPKVPAALSDNAGFRLQVSTALCHDVGPAIAHKLIVHRGCLGRQPLVQNAYEPGFT
jgi:hypothetical protein